MSGNIYDVYLANPSTTMAATDLIYKGISPYNAGDDSAILYSNLLAQIQQGINTNYQLITASSSPAVQMTSNTEYGTFTGDTSLATLTLPATAALGDVIEINGFTPWTIAQNALQGIIYGSVSTTPGVTGSLSSTAVGDSVKIRCGAIGVGGFQDVWVVCCTQGNLAYV